VTQLKKPNIVYILIDNLGWGDVSIQGGAIPTPRIDELAQEGLRLTNFNVESQCTPTRSAILTGRLPIRSGTHRVTYGLPYGLAPWEYTLAELFSDSEYKTALFGKWHLGDVEGRLPTDQGFDEWFGVKNTTDEAGYSSTPQFDPDVFPQPYSEQAAADDPFFVYISFTQIHPPLGHHPDFDNITRTGIYGDIVTELDYNVGRILDALKECGVSDDTIVILTGDNGAVTVGIGGGSNGPFRGGFTGYEAGLRTVGIVRWPGKIEGGRVSDGIVAALDWFPTLANLIGEGAKIPTDRPIDGIDQSAFLLGDQENSNREHVLYYIGNDLFSVKWRSFKIHLKTVETFWDTVQTHLFPPVYDVTNDPGEDNDLMKIGLFSYSWVYGPMGKILVKIAGSMKEYPNIQPGQEFDGYE